MDQLTSSYRLIKILVFHKPPFFLLKNTDIFLIVDKEMTCL